MRVKGFVEKIELKRVDIEVRYHQCGHHTQWVGKSNPTICNVFQAAGIRNEGAGPVRLETAPTAGVLEPV